MSGAVASTRDQSRAYQRAALLLPPILAFGTEEQKQQWVATAIRGEKVLSLGITEPDAGSDVDGIRTRAIRDGDDWIIN